MDVPSTAGAPVAPSVATPAPALAAAPAPHSFPTSLDEFCVRHSRVERSVELLSAFRTMESAAGRLHATEADFVARLGAFASRPVG
ncbi:MAG TPA: hypothetical protein VGC15_13035 [Acetobacteraceae bacterium]